MTEPVHPPNLRWGATSDAGRVRTENEDDFVADSMVFGVADGMGGHQAGEIASAIAARTLRDRLSAGASSVDVVVAAVVEANAAIFQGAHSNSEQRGMGTTLTALVVLAHPDGSQRLALVNVGDSRTYVFRRGSLRRITMDHSYVQELVSTGHITEQEARAHPRRNIVTRALGIEPTVRVDTWVVPLVRGDRYLLCSDGLVDEVDDDEIAQLVASIDDPQAAADALVAAANENGGRDNVTVVVVDVLEGLDPADVVSDLDDDLEWDSDDEHDRLIDAEAGLEPDTPAAALPPTMAVPVHPVPPARRIGVGTVLFGLGLAAIITLTITLVLVVRHNDTTPATTTTSTSSSTSTSTSTTSTSTTTPTATSSVEPTAAPSTGG